MRSLLILLAALFLQNLALGDTTRHQLSKGPNLSPMMGYRYFNSVNEDGAGGLPSDGSAVFMRDSVEWSLGQGHAFNFQNEARFLLRGSGVDIAYVADPRGELMQYELYDAVDGNSGNIVQSGSVDTNATTPALRIETVATSGTLNPDRLYLLKIKVADTDSSTTRRIIFLDAIDVKSEAPITLSDNTDAAWQFNNFDANLPESNSIGQGRAAGNAAGGSISYTFSGTSLARLHLHGRRRRRHL
jgi:hypothetical protein